jgi:hypothetical protein
MIVQLLFMQNFNYLIYIIRLLIQGSFNSFVYTHFKILVYKQLMGWILKFDFIIKVQTKIYPLFIQDFSVNVSCDANDDGDVFYYDKIIH